jgi:hypothetical protein
MLKASNGEAGSVGKVQKRIERRRRGTAIFARAPLTSSPAAKSGLLYGLPAAARGPAAQGKSFSISSTGPKGRLRLAGQELITPESQL